MLRSRQSKLALLLAPGLLAVACSTQTTPTQPQSLPSIKPPSSTALPTQPSTRPQPASDAVIKAFIESYYAEINHAIATGDVSKLETYSTPACPCRKLVASIKEKSTGSRIRGGAISLGSVSPHHVTPTLAGAQVLYDVARAEVVTADGRVTESIKAARGAQDDMSLVLYRGKWLVANVFMMN